MEADEERIKLEALAEMLALETDDASQEYLMQVYERLDDLGADTAESRAAHLLMGLQFTPAMQNKKCKDFSGGWRMRVALARALFLKPHLLLLDEPTNHLDLEACVWLEEELKTYPTILLLISHSQDFLNGVCNNIMHMEKQVLKTYGGNYDMFMKTRLELMEAQMKQYNWEQDQIAHMKNYIARYGLGVSVRRCITEMLYRCQVRSRQREARETSPVEGEDSGQDGGGRAHGEGDHAAQRLLLLLLVRGDPAPRHHDRERQLPLQREHALHLQEPGVRRGPGHQARAGGAQRGGQVHAAEADLRRPDALRGNDPP